MRPEKTSAITRKRIQKMIREAVRAKMGLISEGAATDSTGQLTISGTVEAFDVNYTGAAPYILAVSATGPDGEGQVLWNAETEGQVYTEKNWPGLTWLKGRPAGTYFFSVDVGNFDTENRSSTLDETLAVSVELESSAAATQAAPAAPEAAAGAGTSTAPGVLGVGVFGEYSVDEDRIILLPRETYEPGGVGMLVVRRGGDKEDRITAEKGIPVELLQSYRPGEKYYIFSSSYDVGDGYDLVVDGKVESFQVVTGADGKNTASSITPPPLDPAVREIEAGGPSAEPEGGATSGETKPTYMPKEGEPGSDMEKLDPQLAAGDVQQKIRNVGVAVKDRAFSDITEEGIISVDDVAAENALAGHTWITNSENDRAKFKLDNWSDKWGDPYTYFALVNNETEKPIAFVVASDPQDNNHFSTGRFIGPDSKRPNLRRAFCYLYHRATGEVHETCVDGPTAGPDDDRPKGSGGGGKGKGKGGGAGTGTGSGGGREDDTYKKGKGPGAIKLVSKDGHAVRGKGDIMTGIAGIGLRPAEKLRGAGRKIITKSKDNRGFSSFPKGPGNKFLRNPISAGGGKIPPSALGVFFQHPMAIITDAEGANPYINFGKNTSPENILKIRMGWGAFGRIGLRGALTAGLTLKPGDDGFDEAAAWILSHQEEFDLRPDGFVIEDPMDVKDVSPDENRGASLGERAINEARRTRSLTPLFDRYRF